MRDIRANGIPRWVRSSCVIQHEARRYGATVDPRWINLRIVKQVF